MVLEMPGSQLVTCLARRATKVELLLLLPCRLQITTLYRRHRDQSQTQHSHPDNPNHELAQWLGIENGSGREDQPEQLPNSSLQVAALGP